MNQRSEVAHLIQQIERETQAMQLAMTGSATVASHAIIAHRYDTIGHYREQLVPFVGEEQATNLMVDTYSSVVEGTGK